MPVRQFRFAVQVSALTQSPRQLADLARQAEDLGYSAVFVPDHLSADQWSPLTALAVIAQATTVVSLGGLVFCNDYRHPLLLAQELATLHELSQGRVEFGLGAGWMNSDYQASGIAMDSPGVRIDRLAEAIEILAKLFSERSCTFEGQHYKVADARLQPSRLERPPRLIVGGGGRKMLDLAARHADIVGVNVNLASGAVGPELVAEVGAEAFDRRIGWVREAAGERFAEVELQCLTFVAKVSPGAREWVASMAPAFGLGAEDALEVPIVLAGEAGEVAETIEKRRERYGFSHWVVHQAELAEFAPVVSRLAGH